jgi:ubiquinone/menaquinone biosynthesis C-methylase UbiE
MTTVEELDRRYYPDVVDEHERFDRMVRRYLTPDAVVLDAGAGRGVMFPNAYREHVGRMVGVDVDPAVLQNPNLSEATVADLSHLPYTNGEFDVVFSKFVFEHLERPVAVMRELRRVLRPGGHLLIHTPNRWHYVTIAAALTPTRVHAWYRKRLGWEIGGTFPTKYRANGQKTLVRLASRAGFRVVSLDQLEIKPGYLTLHPVAYRLGIGYERLVNRHSALARFRVNLLVDLEAV